MPDAIPHVQVVEQVSAERFRDEIRPAGLPVLLKGAVLDWPVVHAGRESPEAAAGYIKRFDRGHPVETILGRPEIAGRFFYNEHLDGLNFARMPERIAVTVERMLAARGQADPPSFYIQSASINDYLPGFAAENVLPLLHRPVPPRIWIGNRLTVQTHFDLSENLACCVAGKRRFTVFPPEQTPNLYPGPFELTLAGPPVSMVQLDAPDLDRYPKFETALRHALRADLEPGDVLYLPYFWWHHVETIEDFNVLVNYWWNDAPPDLGSPFDALLHALLAIRDLPERQRAAWRMMFGHYAFGENGDPVAHLPPPARGALGPHDPAMRQNIRMRLIAALARQAGLKPPGRR
jgi:hypothetical protein